MAYDAWSELRDGAVSNLHRYTTLLLCVAGLGGLLYGMDVGIIGGALPQFEAISHFDAARPFTIVAVVLLGSVISSVFAGLLSD